MLNKWRDHQRRHTVVPVHQSEALLSDLVGPDDAADFEEAEYRRHLVSRALRLMQVEFQSATWQACWEHVVSGRPAAEVAAEWGLSVDSVYS
jgi:DNA-directed RNA polymerase specialized sigma24 family protein